MVASGSNLSDIIFTRLILSCDIKHSNIKQLRRKDPQELAVQFGYNEGGTLNR